MTAEQVLGLTEDWFREFAESSTSVLWILNAETRQFDYLSPAYERVWGRPRSVPQADWTDTIHLDDREIAASALEQAISGELVVREYRIVRPNGAVHWIHDTLFPIRDARARGQRIGGIAEDVTVHDGSIVYVVNGAQSSRETLSALLQKSGYSVKEFASGAAFIEVAPVVAMGCVVLVDIFSSQSRGLAITRRLKVISNRLPVIATGSSGGDATLAVQAMKAGAVDWLEMPYQQQALPAAVATALANIRHETEERRRAESARQRIAGMSTRERQVLDGLLAGGTGKTLAKELGISPRTVELHRAGVLERLGARTLSEAALIAAVAGIRPPQPKKTSL